MSAPWTCRYSQDIGNLSAKLSDLKEILSRRLYDVLAADTKQLSDDADATIGRAFETMALFVQINETAAGLMGLSTLIRKYTTQALSGIVTPSSSLDFRFAAKTGRIVEFIKGLTEWCRQRLERINGLGCAKEAQAVIFGGVLSEAESATMTVMRSFLTERKVLTTVLGGWIMSSGGLLD